MLNKISYGLAFFIATYSITEFFTGYHYFKEGNVAQGYLMNSLWLLAFIGAMAYLAYKIYSEEKDRNNLNMNFMPFEFIYKKLKGVQS